MPTSSSATLNVARGARASGPAPRFLPGVVIADRYRIVGLLGHGGMGEVYRADDLKLAQPVALKFLPPGFEADPRRLELFLDEVRIARQVSHVNVCRIYDAGETEGQHFLSMEYVDGEDLASLLRRIGHLPKDKAIQIARQLCAGLAASHEIGVLHRDLKPSNVMIDGRGRARITDFGLAAFEKDVEGADIRSGTPAYMAPEQLAGREVTVRSDLYSLGLVLYELFTGKPAFPAASLAELRRLQSESTPSSPSSLIEGFDPLVERVILRCLEADPARRPSSALSVAAALPGGDPLAAALAAGETPSPEMVAEVGNREAVSPAVGWGALAVFVAALAAIFALSSRSSLLSLVPLEKPPEVLRERAREILALAGQERKPADSAMGFDTNRPYLDDLTHRARTAADLKGEFRRTPPSGMMFQYRQSPTPLVPFGLAVMGKEQLDPPDAEPGMAHVDLDPEGRLVSFRIVPGERASASNDSVAAWQPLLKATGVDPATLAPAIPEWAPPAFAERRFAWIGKWPGRPEIPFRIEVASSNGRPVSLQVIPPWKRAAEESKTPEGFWRRAGLLTNVFVFYVFMIAAGLVALRNVRRGRGDRRGALRFALYMGALRMVWYITAHHVASTEELNIFMGHLAYAMMRVGLAYVFYLAIEPYARRLWPRLLVSWVRVLDGRFRDPLVGRDLLLGCTAGALNALASWAGTWVGELLGARPQLQEPQLWMLQALRGPLAALVSVIAIHTQALFDMIVPLTVLLVFRLLLRRTIPAAVVLTLIGMIIYGTESASLPSYVIKLTLGIAIFWVVLFRCGLLGITAMLTVDSLIKQLPLTPRPESWYLGPMLLGLAAIVAPALWGFWTSRAGRPLLRDEILEPAQR